MPRTWRSDAAGYGLVTRWLHWLTVALVLAQFVVGYLVEVDDGGRGRGRGRGRGGDDGGRGRGRGRGGDDEAGLDDAGLADQLTGLVPLHVALGTAILAIAVVRMWWRATTPLPDWAPFLSTTERKVLGLSEKALLACLVLIPVTGAVLLLGDDDLLWAHVATHLLFFAALAVHVGLVLRHTVVRRDGMLGRMA